MVEENESLSSNKRQEELKQFVLSAMHDWTKSGWYLLANRDIEVLCGSDRESLSNENFTTRELK